MNRIATLFLLCVLPLLSSYAANEKDYGSSLPIVANAGTGPVMDVVVDESLAYAIGGGTLHMVDIANPLEPKVLGKLGGLGEVRQLVVRDGIAYIGSRHDGLFIVDATDPEKPELLKHYDTVEFATGMELAGDVLFAASQFRSRTHRRQGPAQSPTSQSHPNRRSPICGIARWLSLRRRVGLL